MAVAPDTAVWDHAGKRPGPIRWVLLRAPNQSFESPALRSTHVDQTPEQLLTGVLRRWTMDVRRDAARAPLGLETPRQGKARARARTTPALVRLAAIITLTAPPLLQKELPTVRLTAW